jgi:hypothetical protein
MASGRFGSFVLGELFARALTGGKVSGRWREKQEKVAATRMDVSWVELDLRRGRCS